MGIEIGEKLCPTCTYRVNIYVYSFEGAPHPGCNAVDKIPSHCFKTGQQIMAWLDGNNSCKANQGICNQDPFIAETIISVVPI